MKASPSKNFKSMVRLSWTVYNDMIIDDLVTDEHKRNRSNLFRRTLHAKRCDVIQKDMNISVENNEL